MRNAGSWGNVANLNHDAGHSEIPVSEKFSGKVEPRKDAFDRSIVALPRLEVLPLEFPLGETLRPVLLQITDRLQPRYIDAARAHRRFK